MDDWQKDWWQQLEKTAGNVEKFFHNIERVMEFVSEEVTETIEEFSEQLQDALITDIDRCVEDLLDFMTDINLEIDYNVWEDLENFASDTDFVEVTTESPTKDNYAACIGCQHYHGHSYNGQILVCGMHPFGYEDENCPDWEGL